jgi:7,8-dihydropterin-6-yl-methyl-4-(beta-D-ribofuranosyl)aminobenzene 5'-phosphate synthase
MTILVDNEARQGLLKEHGFSAWIEVAGLRVLFDTGQGPAFAANARSLGVDPSHADMIVLSHGHFDHSGGLTLASACAPGAPVFAHPDSLGPRYAVRNGAAQAIGMPAEARAALEAHPAGVRWTSEAMQLADGVGVTGPVPRLTGYEDTGGPFFIDPEGAHPDPITDDLALWVRTDRGLVVIAGCCHAGLVNTLRQAMKLSGEPRLRAVLGGFHLGEAGEARLAETLCELRSLGPELIVPCHCTGAAAVQRLAGELGERVVPGFSGARFRFGADRGRA